DGFTPEGTNYTDDSASEIFEVFNVPSPVTTQVWMLGGRTGDTTDQILIGVNAGLDFIARIGLGNSTHNISATDVNGQYHISRVLTGSDVEIDVYKDNSELTEIILDL